MSKQSPEHSFNRSGNNDNDRINQRTRSDTKRIFTKPKYDKSIFRKVFLFLDLKLFLTTNWNKNSIFCVIVVYSIVCFSVASLFFNFK